MLTSAYVCWAVFDDTLYWTTRTFEANKKFKKNKSPISSFALGSSLVGLVMMWVSLFFLISALIYYVLFKNFVFYFWSFKFSFICIKYSGCIFFGFGYGLFTSILNAKFRDKNFQ